MDKYFLDICLLSANMSKDPSTKVGAVIVGPDKEIRSVGFNGFPRGINDTEERLNNRDTKLSLIVHAELNAILNAARIGVSTKGCTMYMLCISAGGNIWGGAPCNRCTVELIQAGISEIVTLPAARTNENWIESVRQAQQLIAEAGINLREVDYS